MTRECERLLVAAAPDNRTVHGRACQARSVDEYNSASRNYLEAARANGARIGWWDHNAALPHGEAVCTVQADGVHLQMWVNRLLARLLLTELCQHWPS